MTAHDLRTAGPAPDALRIRPTLGQALGQCLTLAWRGVVKIPSNPLGLGDVVIGPAIFLLLFGYVFGGAIAGDTDAYLQYVFPGIVAMMTLFATMGVAVALSTDLSTGVFDRLRSLPIVRCAPLVGAIGTDVVRQIVSLVALLGFGLLLGVRLEAGALSVLAAGALALAFALALSWVWVLLALVVAETQAVQGLAAVLILPLTFASNVFVPVDTMPGWLQGVARANPVSHLVDALRGLLMGGPVAEPVLTTLLWMAGFVILFAPLSLLAYSRRA
jgi:ABC-2 type transport system permease protein/oleandomycin transport system permease protein